MSAYYNLFKRQWQRGKATEEDLNLAVEKEYITEKEKQEIMEFPQND